MVYFCFVYLYFFPIMKIVSEKFGGFTLIYLICNRKGALCALVRCFGAVPYWINRSVMLFLASWKPRKFSIIAKNVWRRLVCNRGPLKQMKTDVVALRIIGSLRPSLLYKCVSMEQWKWRYDGEGARKVEMLQIKNTMVQTLVYDF